MEIKDTAKVYRMPKLNIRTDELPEVEELYLPVKRKHYAGLDCYDVIDIDGKEFIHHEIGGK